MRWGFDTVVVGAGFAGAVTAERLAARGERVLVVERRMHLGGNCYDSDAKLVPGAGREGAGILVHRYGPHLFHTEDADVWEYVSRFGAWDVYQHRVEAIIDGRAVPLPFSLETLRGVFPASMAARMEEALLRRYDYGSRIPILTLLQSDDSDLVQLAHFVYEKVFLHYTMKQWGLSPESIEGAVTARVPVLVGRDTRYFPDRFQGVPTEGYGELFRHMLDHPCIKILLNTSFDEVIEIRGGRLFFMGQPFDGRVVYTGMVDELFGFRFGELPYRSLRMRFETIEAESYQSAPVVNYPNNYDFTRITEFKKIHPVVSPRTVILREYPEAYERGRNIPYYPIFTEKNQAMYERYREEAEKIPNLILVGRLAEYRYYDMDDIVRRALDLCASLA